MNSPVKALLFDLGGVVIDVSFAKAFQDWSASSKLSFAEIQNRFEFDDPFQQFERGEISTLDYFAHLRQRLKLTGNEEQITQGWDAIITGQINETIALIKHARQKLPCYAFSNTNEMHIALLNRHYADVLSTFDQVFLSSHMGMRKPERAAFEFIAQSIDVAVHEILFFDDLAENVTGARQAGLQAVLVRHTDDVRDALATLI